jgi:hypothetical protein
MDEEMRRYLIDEARQRHCLNYLPLSRLFNYPLTTPNDRAMIGHELGEISLWEHRHNRPFISAIVVNREAGMPGSGFFNLPELVGNPPIGKTEAIREEFWVGEVNRCFEYWTNDSHYADYYNI